MSEVDWSLLAQYPNAGQAFEQSFQKGQQQNALAAFATNPGPQTAGAAARFDPSAVLDYNLHAQNEKIAANQLQLNEWHKYAGSLAKWADTPEKWDQAINHLLSVNHPDISTPDLMALKGRFDPALRQSFMALGGAEDDKPDELTSYMTNAGIDPGSPKGKEMYGAAAINRVDPQQPIQTANPDGTIQVNWVRPPMPSSAGQSGSGSIPITATDAHGNKVQYDPQKGWQPLGDAGGNASGGFR